MGRQSSLVREDKREFYARQWFTSMAKFHGVSNPTTWEFAEEHLIAFLRFKLKQKVPTWKRKAAWHGKLPPYRVKEWTRVAKST